MTAASSTLRVGLVLPIQSRDHDPSTAWVGGSREECEHVWAPHAMQVHRPYCNLGVYLREFEPWAGRVADRVEFTLDRLAPGRFLYGSPEEVRATVVDWCDRTGVDSLAVRMRPPGGPGHEATLEAISRLRAEVLAPFGATATEREQP